MIQLLFPPVTITPPGPVDLHGINACEFSDGAVMLAYEATALHLSAKQAAALEAWLLIRKHRP